LSVTAAVPAAILRNFPLPIDDMISSFIGKGFLVRGTRGMGTMHAHT